MGKAFLVVCADMNTQKGLSTSNMEKGCQSLLFVNDQGLKYSSRLPAIASVFTMLAGDFKARNRELFS